MHVSIHDADMFSMDMNQVDWCSARDWHAEEAGLAKDVAGSLTVTSSLTRFLERRFTMPLTVQLHEQFLDKIKHGEAELLHSDVGAPALRRQVSLLHRGTVMFDAESVLPLAGLESELIEDLQEGKRPLANLLLDRGLSLARSDLCVAKLAGDTRYAGCWARRSVLRSPSGTQALVVEVFRPEFWRRLERLLGRA